MSAGAPSYRWLPAVAATVLLSLSGVVQAAPAPQAGDADDAGVKVRWTYTPRDDADGLGILDVRITDAAAGVPLQYGSGRLAAWLQRRRGALSDAEIGCAEKVKMLATQGIGRRADIDLNAYRLVTLNTDGTVAFINPFVGLNNAKLESVVVLPGMPRTWLHLPERMEAWVVLDQPAKLVAIDLNARRIIRTIDLPADAGARDLAVDTAGRSLWVSFPGRDQLAMLDLSDPGATLSTVSAPGTTALRAAAEPGPAAPSALPGVISLHADGGIALRDGTGGMQRWIVDGTPRDVGYSALAQRVIAGTEQGELVWIDPQAADGAIERHMRLDHPIHRIAVFDGGRRALALGGGRASVVDLAAAQPALRLDTVPGADRVVLTDNFAYAVSARAGRATLWSLADLRTGRAQPVEVTLGRPAPAEEGASPAGLDRAVAAPGGNGLLAANATDGMVYQYSEGMMAPVGSYSNYRRAALGLALVDLSLRQVSPGHHRGIVRHSQGGTYELVLSGVGPRFATCATLALAPAAEGVATTDPRPRAELLAVVPAAAGQSIRVRLRRSGGEGNAEMVSGITDLTLLVFNKRDGWQQRVRMRETQAGEYRADVRVPRVARYELLASSVSQDLPFADGRVGEAILGGPP